MRGGVRPMEISSEALVSLRNLVAGWTRENVKVASLEEAEKVVERVSRACAETVFEQSLVELGGRNTLQGSSIVCGCGGRARFVSYRRRWIKSICAEAQIERAYYHCSECGHGHLRPTADAHVRRSSARTTTVRNADMGICRGTQLRA